MKYREGLIVGSACEAGELYRAIATGKSDETILKIASFYDYLEIQPCGNNRYMIDSERFPLVNSIEDIQNMNRKVVHVADKLGKVASLVVCIVVIFLTRVLLILYKTFEVCAIIEHVRTFSYLVRYKLIADVDGCESSAVIEHIAHICHILCIEISDVERGET